VTNEKWKERKLRQPQPVACTVRSKSPSIKWVMRVETNAGCSIFLISHFFILCCNYNNVMAHLIEWLLDRSVLTLLLSVFVLFGWFNLQRHDLSRYNLISYFIVMGVIHSCYESNDESLHTLNDKFKNKYRHKFFVDNFILYKKVQYNFTLLGFVWFSIGRLKIRHFLRNSLRAC
jgi:hypothetical protein